MSILSDSEIAELCELPERRFNQGIYDAKVMNIITRVSEEEYASTLHRAREDSFVPVTPKEREEFVPMITPFHREQIRYADAMDVWNPILDKTSPMPPGVRLHQYIPERKIISKGLSSYGYDVSLAEEFKLFTNINSTLVDPKRLDEKCLVDAEIHMDPDGSKYVIIPPNSYLLGRTVEYFRIPNDVMVIALGKSTYARAGAIVNVTPIEPGFEGNVVIEISNTTPLPMKIYALEGISQFIFFRGNRPARVTYADRNGKYQGQTGIVLPKV